MIGEPAFFDGLSTEMVDIILNECTVLLIPTHACIPRRICTMDMLFGISSKICSGAGRVVMDEADEGLSLCQGQECGARCARRRAAPVHLRRFFITMT